MRNRGLTPLFVLLLTANACAQTSLTQSQIVPPLPQPVSNNAVVSLNIGTARFIVSFAGLGAGRSHADTLASTFVYDSHTGQWQSADPLPGGAGRLAAVAAAAGGLAYVFGGYTVAEDGTEVSTPWVHAFDPEQRAFAARAAMPVAVDDAVAVTFQDRYIYLISGWHDHGNVNLVQRYDTRTDTWVQATPTPGPSVFGHAGGIVDNTIVYCDGVAVRPHKERRRDFVAVSDCYLGLIDSSDGRKIDWRVVSAHPGLPRYRMAAAGVTNARGVLFIGGSENPYNYNGIGYDGEPSQPARSALLYDVISRDWRTISFKGEATMDHRGLVHFDQNWLTVGGMRQDQRVVDTVNTYVLK